jgi:hypothetical protein
MRHDGRRHLPRHRGTGGARCRTADRAESTREILGEMGYGVADIEKLSASGVVACYRG